MTGGGSLATCARAFPELTRMKNSILELKRRSHRVCKYFMARKIIQGNFRAPWTDMTLISTHR